MSLKSVVLIVPAEHRADGNQLAIQLGYDVEPGHTYAVPLSPTGAEPATHYGCRPWSTPGFVLLLQMATTGVYSDGVSPELVAMADAARAQYPDMLANLIVDVRDDADGHWQAVLDDWGLAMVSEDA